jgi:hypothetical protein
MATVVLDGTGAGDTTNLAIALERVADGGVILVRPGTYRAGVMIRRNVTLRGIADARGNAPTLETLFDNQQSIFILSGAVVLEGLNIRAQGAHSSALVMSGGSLTGRDLILTWTGTRIVDHQIGGHAAAVFSGDSRATLQRSRIGPGETQALTVAGRANVGVTDSTIINNGGDLAVFLAAGSLSMNGSAIMGAATALSASDGIATITHTIIRSTRYRTVSPVFFAGTSALRIEWSVACVADGYPWSRTQANGRITAAGIFNGTGRMVESVLNPTDFPDQARRVCAGYL